MKKIINKYVLMNLVMMMSLSSAVPAFADGPGEILSEEYEIVEDGYIYIDEISEDEIKNMVAVNSPEAIEEKNEEILQSQTNIHYTINDNGHHARLSDELQDWVYQMCAEYGIPGYEKVIIAKLYCESNFNPNAYHRNKNGTTDHGIAQINSSNHSRLRKTLGITNFMDPHQSIRAGVYMFSECLKQNNFNEQMALVAYNTGRNGRGPTKYSNRVLSIKNSAFAS